MTSLKQMLLRYFDMKFYKPIQKLLAPILSGQSISLLDIGAANGIAPRWHHFKQHINYFGVEPDPRSEHSVLVKNSKSEFNSETLITKALWSSEGTIQLNLCRKPMTSSTFKPDRQFASLFPDEERFDVMETIKMPCTTVDAISATLNQSFDVLKLDIQGAELEVLKGASASIGNSLAAEVEVEFHQMYEQQPLFDQIFAFMKSQGFDFVDFITFYRFSPDINVGLGQLTFADALFMRSPELISKSSDASVIRRYSAICAIYERGDLLTRLSRAMSAHGVHVKLISEIFELGNQISIRNHKTLSKYTLASKLIQIQHPSARAHMVH